MSDAASPAPDDGPRERHPDHGRLIRDEDTDTVICHVCGRAFRALGSHVRVHGMTGAQYRQAFGLLRTRAMSARSLSREQSRVRLAAYEASEEARERFAAGREMARSGELSRRRWDRARGRETAEELYRVRRDSLGAGRRTQARDADERLRAALRAGGFTDVGQALQVVYVERQSSIEETARLLAVGKARLRTLLLEHGIAIRPAGFNSPSGRRSRVALNDRATAERVGATDITAWLRRQVAAGATLRELAAATGHSVPWVVARLRRR